MPPVINENVKQCLNKKKIKYIQVAHCTFQKFSPLSHAGLQSAYDPVITVSILYTIQYISQNRRKINLETAVYTFIYILMLRVAKNTFKYAMGQKKTSFKYIHLQ